MSTLASPLGPSDHVQCEFASGLSGDHIAFEPATSRHLLKRRAVREVIARITILALATVNVHIANIEKNTAVLEGKCLVRQDRQLIE